MKYQPDDADEVTVIDQGPHWSSVRSSLVRAQTVRSELAIPSIVKRSAPPPSARAHRSAKGTPPPPVVTRFAANVETSIAPPQVTTAPIAALPPPIPRLPPRLPPAVQRSAATVTPIAPLPVVAEPVYMLPFYSHAESQAQYGVETERVDPLPMSSLRPSWEEMLVRTWQRFAAPICGAIAGLIFVVGYLAYSSQPGAAIASSATPVAPVVMPAEVAMAAPVDESVVSPAAVAEPTVTEVHVAKPAKAAKRVTKRVAPSSKRRAVRLNDTTPLGDLRPSRSR